MACNDLSVPDAEKVKNLPNLTVTHFTIEPGAAVEEARPSSDCLIIGINGR